METKFCWRCRTVFPFLNEEEYAEIAQLYHEGFSSSPSGAFPRIRTLWKDISSWFSGRRRNPSEIIEPERPSVEVQESFEYCMAPLVARHEELTGWGDIHYNAIMHHRLSLLGPECPQCGLPLRSPKAKMCPECGWDRRDKA